MALLPGETVPNPCLSELPNFPPGIQHLVGGKTRLEYEGEAFPFLSNFETKAAKQSREKTQRLRKALNKGLHGSEFLSA